uniref:DUF3403 domain-containing protein n=1 Tax=Globodera pallida TaxID=36090 RepID=A0A183CTU6_GLOPA
LSEKCSANMEIHMALFCLIDANSAPKIRR